MSAGKISRMPVSAAVIIMLAMAMPSWAAVPSYLPYPSADPVIMNPYGATDEAARLIAAMQPFYRTAFGRSLKVEEAPGRGGATAWGALADKDGDGYTLALTNLQSLILRGMSSRPAYRPDEIFNCNIMAEAPLMLWVPQNSPFRGIADLINSARAYPNQMIISGAGSGTQTHLATQRLNFLGGVKIVYLPYIGAATAMEAARAGRAHAAWGFPLPDYGVKPGMRPLAVAAEKRLAHMPDVPTFEEAGIGLFETACFGLAIPASAPAGTRQAVSDHFGKIIADKDFQAALVKMGFTPRAVSLEGVAALVESEEIRLRGLVEQFSLE